MLRTRMRRRTAATIVLLVTVLALSVGTAGAGPTKRFAVGGGTAVGQGVTKHFAFSAHQRSAVTLDASGYVVEVQDDPTGVFGDFRLQGPVQCVRVVGDHAIIGMTIDKGSGTAAGHEGEAFYLTVDDGDTTSTPDRFDNSGYTGTTTADCNYEQATVGVVVQGNIQVK